MFRRMKEWRQTALRYDRLAGNFLSAIELIASACFWLA
jgi:transposase